MNWCLGIYLLFSPRAMALKKFQTAFTTSRAGKSPTTSQASLTTLHGFTMVAAKSRRNAHPKFSASPRSRLHDCGHLFFDFRGKRRFFDFRGKRRFATLMVNQDFNVGVNCGG